ncbi:preprotein translocase subunit SecG [Granulicoccus phenolivorans]|uniref:preprotein translocase subunit SecG n=1 Tax=Granulicoccus phenolivorans TaxID=266854 RepID=UPI000686B6FB|nr:preprotein translocase subunit SecG [Granulicoccus phenolivorans]
MSWPVLTVSIVVVVLSVILALMILLHKGRGGGLSDLFGGGMSTSLGGTSIAERNLDRITTIIGVLWVLAIIGLLLLYRYYPNAV